MSFNLPASPITGTFNIAGSITVTPTTITWNLADSPFTPNKAVIGSPATGSFAGLPGSTVTISNLDLTLQPVNTPFPLTPFITFDSPAASSFPTLDINFIYPGTNLSSGCTATPPAVGQMCTPIAGPGPGPFNFQNTLPNPPAGPFSTASFIFGGTTSDGLENWSGVFTSQFTVPYQAVLAQLASTGSVTNTFSATFILTPTPESGTMALLGIGLITLSAKLRRRRV